LPELDWIGNQTNHVIQMTTEYFQENIKIGCIYLAKLDAHLKLGFTQNLGMRLKSFETTNVRVDLVYYIGGTFATERELHWLLGSKVRELYDLEAEDRIVEAMIRTHHEQIKRRFDFDS
jgi:hypothetical protein